MERVRGELCKQMGFLPVPSKCQSVQTLNQRKQETELDIKHHKGMDGRHQTQNTDIQCSSNLWRGSCKNMPHLIFQNY